MQPDSEVNLNQVTGGKTGEFGRSSEEGPAPTKQDLELGYLDKYDLILSHPDDIAVRCIGCMDYIYEDYLQPVETGSYQKEFKLNIIVYKIIEHHLSCTHWNK